MENVIFSADKIVMDAKISNKQEAITLAGQLLVQGEHVTDDYIKKMFEREELMTTYIGNGVAIPHGTNESKEFIKSSGISIIQVPNGVDFGNGNIAYLIIGIAGIGDEHLEILSNIAIVCSEEENVKTLVNATTKEAIIEIFERG
ncbi:MAG: phosphoenolpyruvate-dependent sugar phosphotransferase system 2 [Firmicutes bacterium]|jgi:PTS system mannitol-specific IIA component|uniref:Mannitol-specific phosphotransferase enzyme IIA component n=2 Tax=Pelosinus TaxID=365348 RepID=I8TWH1_9FIRM|nr:MULTISPECIES: PTS sugar transporter subunit IIA [Pelosinus]AJQ28852.1 phosphoenolpyruvate-dependent sugar phosphotransferase system EIIA 2 [Pelosinus fermentans JBW45]MBP2658511.1 phosphoenolpyruvate-dependent sugar phosphotransferase system 2 [Bacillota bacterium]MCC5465928.1 PTS sugar transporter subunit IIA [Pelosinus baikalensis]